MSFAPQIDPLALGARDGYISAGFPDIQRRAGQNGPSVHLSHAGSLQDLSGRTGRCWITSTCRSTRTPRSACSASTARASRPCCASWPASTRSTSARAGSRRARASATCEQEPHLDERQDRARERHGGRRRQEGADRPLQRDRRELLGRNRRRDGEAAGRDRRQEPVGSRQSRSIWRWMRCAARPTMPT